MSGTQDTALLAQLAKEIKEAKTPVIRSWPKEVIPDKVGPGLAVVCDQFGNGVQVIEGRKVMSGGAATVCLPLDGIERGEMLFGDNLQQVLSGELVVLQFTKYPEQRPQDGAYCVLDKRTGGPGVAAYPNTGRMAALYEDIGGTFYNKNNALARDMADRARAAMAPKPVQMTTKG